ncbi:GntR family transcriptional regulator [Niveispirillum sp. KHB5.9]|uniref:GntR family transcriptional regulator n=1 Tax=Niveispirillum sp. KHB5.9 TaxID=3400269 RepID=UPI003A8831F8
MYGVEQISRSSVSSSVAASIRAMILDGRLADGERINEVKLAAALGVSRTPLREALNRLASEGALLSVTGHGHTVAPLSVAEFDQLYDIRPILDPAALAMCPLPSDERLAELAAVNAEFRRADDGEHAIDLDNQWHLLLLADCPNRVLVGMIESIIAKTRRYELALLRERPHVQAAGDDHDRIMDALGDGDRDGACDLLRRNMQSGKQPVLAWLRAREVS